LSTRCNDVFVVLMASIFSSIQNLSLRKESTTLYVSYLLLALCINRGISLARPPSAPEISSGMILFRNKSDPILVSRKLVTLPRKCFHKLICIDKIKGRRHQWAGSYPCTAPSCYCTVLHRRTLRPHCPEQCAHCSIVGLC